MNTGRTHFKKGHISWSKGLTKETDERIKIRGENHSQLMKNLYSSGKLINPMLGKKSPWTTKRNLENNPMNNPKNVLKMLQKMNFVEIGKKESQTKRRLFMEGKLRIWNEGKKHLPETIEKIKEARTKQILPIKDTSIEVKIQNFLKQLGIEYLSHFYVKDIEYKYRCDIFIPSKKMIIECDGDYFHANPKIHEILNQRQIEQKKRDEIRTKQLLEKGYKLIRLWESEINNMNLNDFQEIL